MEFHGQGWQQFTEFPWPKCFDTYTIPLLVNTVYRIPIKGPWSAYVGVGAGGAATILSYNTQLEPDLSDFRLCVRLSGEGGFEIPVDKKCFLDVAYEFLGTTDPSWSSTQTVGAPD